MNNAERLRQLLDGLKLQPLKQLGQNFLIDPGACRRIAALVQAQAGETVLEIGPGLGALTMPLLERGLKVRAVEIDKGLAAYLKTAFRDEPRFELVEGDALKLLPGMEVPRCLAGNLPYHISSPLLASILEGDFLPEHCTFMLQKETAERLAAKPRTKAYGGLSVFVQACMAVRLEFNLGGGHFYPPPDVASTVLTLARRSPLPLAGGEERRKFNAFLRRGFSQRRKKLKNVLPTGLDQRPEELAVEDWLELYGKIGRHL